MLYNKQQRSKKRENYHTYYNRVALLIEKYLTEVVQSTESYKMLATTPGRSTVDTHSRSVFVKGELSISNAKGQLLLAGLFLTGVGTTV